MDIKELLGLNPTPADALRLCIDQAQERVSELEIAIKDLKESLASLEKRYNQETAHLNALFDIFEAISERKN